MLLPNCPRRRPSRARPATQNPCTTLACRSNLATVSSIVVLGLAGTSASSTVSDLTRLGGGLRPLQGDGSSVSATRRHHGSATRGWCGPPSTSADLSGVEGPRAPSWAGDWQSPPAPISCRGGSSWRPMAGTYTGRTFGEFVTGELIGSGGEDQGVQSAKPRHGPGARQFGCERFLGQRKLTDVFGPQLSGTGEGA